MSFFVNHTSGVICAPITGERADRLELPLMVPQNTEVMRTAFTVSVDYRHGTTTGISAHDRALTLRALVDDEARPPISPGRVTSSRSGPEQEGSSSGPGTPRRRSICARSPASNPSACCAKSSGVTARWPGFPTSSNSPGTRSRVHLDRRPDPLSPPNREARAPGRRSVHPHRRRHLRCRGVRVDARR